ncbi:MAG TPA: ferritin, partial [Verrucomicrobiae bacterium]|nr:ferritin [Verrucomicrobiae bacterium]
MLSSTMSEALNAHLGREQYSAQLYLSMSAYAANSGMKGAANWFQIQFREEMLHFMKFYSYLVSHGTAVRLPEVPAPPFAFASLLDAFEQTLDHEQKVTRWINELADLALAERDHATSIFLQWFITEQVEEEENAREIIAKLRLIGDNGQGLLMLDKEFAARTFVQPAGE